MKKTVVIVLFCIFLIGCAYLNASVKRPAAGEYPRKTAHSLTSGEAMQTTIGVSLKGAFAAHPKQSGFRILSSGSESLEARMALVRAAEKTLDVQYYAMNDDVTSNLMAEAIIRAAERGVRVRFLLDDINADSVRKTLHALNDVENIEVRIFNPITTNDQSFFSRIVGTISDLPRINKRMHNKVLIADNLMAVTGGRNLGDEYFDHSSDMAFQDIDMLAAGPIATDLSAIFDLFWNDDDSFPIDYAHSKAEDRDYFIDFRKRLAMIWDEQAQDGNSLVSTKKNYFNAINDRLVWAHAEVTADHPAKVRTPADENHSPPAQKISVMAAETNEEFVIVSSYYVPQEEGVKWIADLTARGVTVRILTNSLASTDVVAAHTGYRPYREDLLRNGAELYEMKPTQKRTRQRLIGTGSPPHASLHSKFYIVDRKKTFVGSFNLDPRSVRLNTEVALVIEGEEIAGQMYDLFKRIISPAYSYKLELDEEGSLIWITEKSDEKVHYRSEPDSSLWRGIQADMISILPIEDHL